MMSHRYVCTCLLAVLVWSASAFSSQAQSAADKAARLTAPRVAAANGACDLGSAQADLDVGNVRARLYNHGGLFWNGGAPLYEVPKGSGINALFASGIWMGGLAGGTELRMAAATYSDWEFWPGPLDANGDAPADCEPYDRIYTVSAADVAAYEAGGTPTDDLRDWPVDLGAPVVDGDGVEGNYDLAAGDRPALSGDQTAWWVMNDAGNTHMTTLTPAIGIEARVTAYAYDEPGALGNSTFYRYELTYKGDQPLQDYYFGVWTDADLGNAGDDYVGSDPALQLGYYYNGDNVDEGGYGDQPPAVGYTMIQGLPAEDGEDQGLTGVIYYNNDASVQGNPGGASDFYGYLKGEWRDGTPITVGGSGYGFSNEETSFMYPGNLGEYWSEGNIDGSGTSNPPGDRRLLLVTGPATLQPGETFTVEYAIAWSQGATREISVALLKQDVASILGIEGPPPVDPPSEAPLLAAPADGVGGQPIDVALRVVEEEGLAYEMEVATDAAFNDVVPYGAGETLPPNTTYFWRARAVNAGGAGPWSETWTFTTGDFANSEAGVLFVDGKSMFVEWAAPGGADPCPAGTDDVGCSAVGGDLVRQSYNSTGEYVLFYEGAAGSEPVLGAFAPRDFEIRFEGTSIAYHAFTTGNAVEVPFTIWDIGNEGPFAENDPADDVQLVPVLFSDGGGECAFDVDEVADDPFGLGFSGTDRIYAYYPATTYADWDAAARPLVEADAEGCPNAYDLTGGEIESRIDFDRGRPLQREVIFSSFASVDELAGTVVRYYTTGENQPALSAPADGMAGVTAGTTLYWTGTAAEQRVQIATTDDFASPAVDVTLADGENRYVPDDLDGPQTYYWRVGFRSEGAADYRWSDTWSFTTATGVATEADGLPERFALHANYPNPFNPATTLVYDVAQAGPVRLTVYDALGRSVTVLVDGAQTAGRHTATFDARSLASGVYFVRMEAGAFTQVRSMLLMK